MIGRALRVALVFAACAWTASDPAHAQGRCSTAGIGVVLIPGAGGMHPNDFLVRNLDGLARYGLTTGFAETTSQAVSSANAFKAQGLSVVLVGMSAGTPKVAKALLQGAPADRIVLTAGMLMPGSGRESVAEVLGSPSRLPPTLVVHNPQDECRLTPPEAVAAFTRWSGGRARASWVKGGPGPSPPCGPLTHHGFFGNDGQAVAAIARFALGR